MLQIQHFDSNQKCELNLIYNYSIMCYGMHTDLLDGVISSVIS